MDTLVGVIVAALVVLPGFVTQELTVRRRPSARDDGQSVIQRALFYAVIIQLAWSWDTWHLVENLMGHHWHRHYAELLVWGIGVLVVSPAVLGFAINTILIRAESGGRHLNRFHYAPGGRDAREAWDYLFQTLDRGAWVLVRLIASTPDAPVMFIGKYGLRARHAQSPALHDVYFDEVWSADAAGQRLDKLEHLSGMWVSAEQIEAMFPSAEQGDLDDSEELRTGFDRGRLLISWRRRLPAATVAAEGESPTAVDSREGLAAAGPGLAAAPAPPP